MNKQEIEVLMEQRGFTLWATMGNSELCFLTLHTSKLPTGINCVINPITSEFKFKYQAPSSTVQLILPRCSPFEADEHFDNMLNMFLKQVNKLKED